MGEKPPKSTEWEAFIKDMLETAERYQGKVFYRVGESNMLRELDDSHTTNVGQEKEEEE